jgi:hypothetical protein
LLAGGALLDPRARWEPSSRQVDELLDERNQLTGRCPNPNADT